MTSVIAISFNIREIGKKIKRTKKEYTWNFKIDFHEHFIRFYYSFLSGKRKLLYDDKKILEENKLGLSYKFEWRSDETRYTLIQDGDEFDLEINGKRFRYWQNALEHTIKTKQASAMNNEFGQVQRKSLFEKSTNDNKYAIRDSPQKPEGRKTLENFTDFNFNIIDPNFEKEKKKIEEKKTGKKTNDNLDLFNVSEDFKLPENFAGFNQVTPPKNQNKNSELNNDPFQLLMQKEYQNKDFSDAELQTFDTNKLFGRDPNNIMTSWLVDLNNFEKQKINLAPQKPKAPNYEFQNMDLI